MEFAAPRSPQAPEAKDFEAKGQVCNLCPTHKEKQMSLFFYATVFLFLVDFSHYPPRLASSNPSQVLAVSRSYPRSPHSHTLIWPPVVSLGICSCGGRYHLRVRPHSLTHTHTRTYRHINTNKNCSRRQKQSRQKRQRRKPKRCGFLESKIGLLMIAGPPAGESAGVNRDSRW